jgi:WD40 repeat protein
MPLQLPAGMEKRSYYDAAFSSDGKLLALSQVGGVVEIWDLIAGKRKLLSDPGEHKNAVCKLACSSSGRFLAAACRDHITIWELPLAKETARFSLAMVGNMAFAASDQTLLALAIPKGQGPPTGQGTDREIVRIDVASGKLKSSVNLGLKTIYPIVSADGRYAALEVKDAWGIYDLETRAKVADLNRAHGFAFSGKGSTLVSCKEGRLSILQVPSGKELKRFDMHPPFMDGYPPEMSVTFDGKLLAAGRYPDANFAGLISLETGKLLDTVECGPLLTICRYIRLSPDGSMLATVTSGIDVDDKPVVPIFKLWKISAVR